MTLIMRALKGANLEIVWRGTLVTWGPFLWGSATNAKLLELSTARDARSKAVSMVVEGKERSKRVFEDQKGRALTKLSQEQTWLIGNRLCKWVSVCESERSRWRRDDETKKTTQTTSCINMVRWKVGSPRTRIRPSWRKGFWAWILRIWGCSETRKERAHNWWLVLYCTSPESGSGSIPNMSESTWHGRAVDELLHISGLTGSLHYHKLLYNQCRSPKIGPRLRGCSVLRPWGYCLNVSLASEKLHRPIDLSGQLKDIQDRYLHPHLTSNKGEDTNDSCGMLEECHCLTSSCSSSSHWFCSVPRPSTLRGHGWQLSSIVEVYCTVRILF